MELVQDKAKAKAIGASSLIAVVLFFSGLFTMLTPLPLLYASAIQGRAVGRAAAALSGAAVLLVYLIALPQAAGSGEGGVAYLLIPGQGFVGYLPQAFIGFSGIAYFAFFVVIALVLAEGSRRRWSLLRWGGTALVAGLAVLASIALAAVTFDSAEILSGVSSYVAFIMGELARAGDASGAASAQFAFLMERPDEVATSFLSLLPSIVFAFAVLAIVINLVVCRRIIKGRHAFSHVHNVARFRMPDGAIWGVIASGAAYFAHSYVLKGSWLGAVALNGLIGFGVLYFLQGMAVIVYFLQGIRMPLLRTLAYVAMILFLQTVSLGLLVVGVADVWVNFRLRRWRTIHHRS